MLQALRDPGKVLNSIYLSGRFGRTATGAFPIVASSTSRLHAHRTARLSIHGRLYLGCFTPVVGDIVDRRTDRTIVRLAESAELTCLGTANLGPGVRLTIGRGAKFSIGDGSYVTCNALIVCATSIEIGKACAISWGVQIHDTNFHQLRGQPETNRPVRIEDNVWIAANAMILKGVTVGRGAVVAAGAVVTKDVPPRTMVAGIPARVIRTDVEWA